MASASYSIVKSIIQGSSTHDEKDGVSFYLYISDGASANWLGSVINFTTCEYLVRHDY